MTDDANATDLMLGWLRRLGRLVGAARRESMTADGRFRLVLEFDSLADLLAAEREFAAHVAMAREDAAALAQACEEEPPGFDPAVEAELRRVVRGYPDGEGGE